MSVIIGLTGKKGVGKDTAASILVRDYGYTRVAFADTLRNWLLALDPMVSPLSRLSEEIMLIGWDEAKRTNPEVRRLLQVLGTEVIRTQVDPDYLVKEGLRRARAYEGPVVITDVRFPNEAAAIYAAGGMVYRVVRPQVAQDDRASQHASETALDRYKFSVILNDSSLDDLEAFMDSIANRVSVRSLDNRPVDADLTYFIEDGDAA